MDLDCKNSVFWLVSLSRLDETTEIMQNGALASTRAPFLVEARDPFFGPIPKTMFFPGKSTFSDFSFVRIGEVGYPFISTVKTQWFPSFGSLVEVNRSKSPQMALSPAREHEMMLSSRPDSHFGDLSDYEYNYLKTFVTIYIYIHVTIDMYIYI